MTTAEYLVILKGMTALTIQTVNYAAFNDMQLLTELKIYCESGITSGENNWETLNNMYKMYRFLTGYYPNIFGVFLYDPIVMVDVITHRNQTNELWYEMRDDLNDLTIAYRFLCQKLGVEGIPLTGWEKIFAYQFFKIDWSEL